MQSVKEQVHANKTIRIYFDQDPSNPRKEYDNIATMVHWHNRYELGDKRIEPCTSEDLIEQYNQDNNPILEIWPLYLYDHSGLSISMSQFSCSFDSGQVGWIYFDTEKCKEYGIELHSDCKQIMKHEVECYDAYLTGQVFGYQIIGLDGDVLESCWGYTDVDLCMSEAKIAAEHTTDPAIERQAEELANRATYAGPSNWNIVNS